MTSFPPTMALSPLRIGTRGSKLARAQADWVANTLQSNGLAVDVVEISTLGDEEPSGRLAEIGREGVFTKEIQRALLARHIDFAVHSLKDLPTAGVDGLHLAAVPQRASSADVLISRGGLTFDALPDGARIGTGSPRRIAQLRSARPDLQIHDIRGNVDTRIRKLDEGQYDAIILAEAGLTRLGLRERITQVLPREVMLPAVGQGALGIECRTDDGDARDAVASLDDAETHQAILAERCLLGQLRAGCLAPVGAWARHLDGILILSAVVLSVDGGTRIDHEDRAIGGEDGSKLGQRVAEALLQLGAGELIKQSKT
jgi:hydroxymethylbilane synthase